jgi:hypothetical protein
LFRERGKSPQQAFKRTLVPARTSGKVNDQGFLYNKWSGNYGKTVTSFILSFNKNTMDGRACTYALSGLSKHHRMEMTTSSNVEPSLLQSLVYAVVVSP